MDTMCAPCLLWFCFLLIKQPVQQVSLPLHPVGKIQGKIAIEICPQLITATSHSTWWCPLFVYFRTLSVCIYVKILIYTHISMFWSYRSVLVSDLIKMMSSLWWYFVWWNVLFIDVSCCVRHKKLIENWWREISSMLLFSCCKFDLVKCRQSTNIVVIY